MLGSGIGSGVWLEILNLNFLILSDVETSWSPSIYTELCLWH
jgi:hypothetical protein